MTGEPAITAEDQRNSKMSEWSENSQRIDVPYPQNSKYICVEHPALIYDEEKAIKTIGGIENVTKTNAQASQRLALRWRPDDKYCKATFGDRMVTTNILMKVKKRIRKSDGKEEYKVEILGRIETTYKFQSMCDFQYLPMQRKEDGNYENIHDRLVMKDFSIDCQKYFSQDVPMFIPPTTFSRVDRPCDFLYRQDIEHRQGYKNPDQTRPANLIGTVRQRRSIYTIFVNFGEQVPTEPLEQAVQKLKSDFVDPKGADVLKEYLAEKPLWLKVELEHRTGFSSEKIKIYLPAMCFYWLDGPWRGQWNKFGHDPTKDPSSKIYQTLDFRIRQVKKNLLDVKAKRSDFKVNQWNQVSRNQKHNVKINIKALGEDLANKGDTAADRELFYKFKPGRNPPQRMMYYPINYIEVDEVQALIHKNDGMETVCTEKDGWCVAGFHETCRDIMYRYMQGIEEHLSKFLKTKLKRRKRTVNKSPGVSVRPAVPNPSENLDEAGMDINPENLVNPHSAVLESIPSTSKTFDGEDDDDDNDDDDFENNDDGVDDVEGDDYEANITEMESANVLDDDNNDDNDDYNDDNNDDDNDDYNNDDAGGDGDDVIGGSVT